MSKNLKNVLIGIIAAAVVVGVILVLIPVEKRNRELKEYGDLAVAAENDQRARYVIDNIDEYPEYMVNIYNNSSEEYREEYLDFVYNYAFHKNDYATMKFTDEELNSEEVPALYMGDFRWAYETIGGDFIKKQGCAAVALTMANLYLNRNNSIDPKIVANKAEELGALNILGGLNSLNIQDVAEALGLNCNYYNYDPDLGGVGNADIDTVRGIIDSGHVLMAGMVGETFGGHAIIIKSCSEEGIMRINDPASPEKTEKEWGFDDIKSEIYYLWELY